MSARKSIDLRDVPRDEHGLLLPALADGNDTSRNRNGDDTSRKIPQYRRDYEREIYLWIATENRAVNRGEICKAMKLKKTNWLIEKIERLVADGFLIRSNGTYRNGFLVYLYQVNDER
jgi:hypothetical protein